jgi:hypothetical protein
MTTFVLNHLYSRISGSAIITKAIFPIQKQLQTKAMIIFQGLNDEKLFRQALTKK